MRNIYLHKFSRAKNMKYKYIYPWDYNEFLFNLTTRLELPIPFNFHYTHKGKYKKKNYIHIRPLHMPYKGTYKKHGNGCLEDKKSRKRKYRKIERIGGYRMPFWYE